MKRGRFLTRDDVIGEDMILATDSLIDTVSPRTLTFVEVMTLTRHDLLTVCEQYPDFDYRVRRAQIKLAIWRAFVRRAGAKARGSLYLNQLIDREKNETCTVRTGFSQSIQTQRGFRGLSTQEAICEVVEEMQSMKRRMQDEYQNTQQNFINLTKQLERVEQSIEELGKQKKTSGIVFCARGQ